MGLTNLENTCYMNASLQVGHVQLNKFVLFMCTAFLPF
jgi:ubiquitin C-terminal hydrolase